MSKRHEGNRCCFASCGVSSSKCRGLSFHKLPAAGVSTEQDEWRAKLIHLANRKDKLFNPNTAKICSRHFTPDCFVSFGEGSIRHLRKGAIPTQWLEQFSITAPKPPLRQTKKSRHNVGKKSSVRMSTTEHQEHQTEPAMMMETLTIDLDREVYNSWCNIGTALSLTTNSQIAHYLVDYFQKHELESKNCLTCGAAFTLHCAFCSERKSSQKDKFSTKASEEGQGQGQNERPAVPLTTSDLSQHSLINQVSDTEAGNEKRLQGQSNYKPKSLKLILPKPVNNLGDKVNEVSCIDEKPFQKSNTLSSPGLPKHCALATNKKLVCRQTKSKQQNLQNKLNLVPLGRGQETTTALKTVIYENNENLSSSIVPDNNQQENHITAKIEDVGDHGESDIASKQRDQLKSVPHCEICKKIFSTKRTLKMHKSIVHDGIKPFECDICNRSFSQRSNLRMHKFSHVDATPHQCGICGMGFKTLSILKKHAVSHSHSKDHICELCGKRFSFSYNLRRHKLTVHYKIKRFACDICSKAFTTSRTLQDHMVIHSSIPGQRRTVPKYAICKTCGKSFHQSYMKLHRMTHSGEKPHVCEVCGRGFIQYMYYKQHMQSHNGDKPYVCNICNKSFSFFSSLSTHKQIHTNPEQFECEVCNKKFKYSSNLLRHKRNHICSSDMNVK